MYYNVTELYCIIHGEIIYYSKNYNIIFVMEHTNICIKEITTFLFNNITYVHIIFYKELL